jgi:hypothetical protein
MTLEEKIAEAIEAWQNDADANPYFVEDGEQSLAQAIAQALSGICVECLELEWRKYLPNTLKSRTPFASYTIKPKPSGLAWSVLIFGYQESSVRSEHPTLESAQQACQADFSSRWASCAKTRTVEEVRREYLEELIAHFDEAAAAEWDNAGCNDQEGGSEKDTKRFVHAAGNYQFCADQLRSLQQEGKSDA